MPDDPITRVRRACAEAERDAVRYAHERPILLNLLYELDLLLEQVAGKPEDRRRMHAIIGHFRRAEEAARKAVDADELLGEWLLRHLGQQHDDRACQAFANLENCPFDCDLAARTHVYLAKQEAPHA